MKRPTVVLPLRRLDARLRPGLGTTQRAVRAAAWRLRRDLSLHPEVRQLAATILEDYGAAAAAVEAGTLTAEAAAEAAAVVERRDGWTTVTHPTAGVALRTTDHASAIAYADRLAREGKK